MNNIASFLLKVEPFNRLPVSEVERLSLMVQVVRHAKGEVIHSEGEMANQVWILQQGRLEIFKYSSEGRPMAMDSIQPRQLYGVLERFGSNSLKYPCTAVACVDCVSICVPDRIFQNLCMRYPAMMAGVCQLCSQRLARLQERLSIYQEPVQQRIIKTLMQLQETNGNELPYTKREISELSATTVETAIRVLSSFQKKRWVSSERGKITLRNIPQLQSLLGGTRDRALVAA